MFKCWVDSCHRRVASPFQDMQEHHSSMEQTSTAVRFPGEDGGRSLGAMAQRDLDAALQLLADRAQYVTGANGAAIALRREGKHDMLCRASSGENVPELGAILSMEFGLSGESVRTRKAQRCDNADRDVRVNRGVCRELGIASVVVMPVVHDDEVLGVFELFSGKVNAFGDRDVSALQRLSEMVETAVRLARASESVIDLAQAEAGETPSVSIAEEVLDYQEETAAPVQEAPQEVAKSDTIVARVIAPVASPVESVPQVVTKPAPVTEPPPVAVPKKPLFWSAFDATVEAPKPAEVDESHVPPMLRNLRKCAACGFPVSSERTLCVECEEKKWRGQLRTPPAAKPLATPRASAVALVSAPVERLKAQAAASAPAAVAAVAPTEAEESSKIEVGPSTAAKAAEPVAVPKSEIAVTVAPEPQKVPEFVLSAGLESSPSWLSRNKYVLGAIAAVAGTVAAILWLR